LFYAKLQGEIDALNTRVHNLSLSAIDTEYTDTSIQSGGVKLVLSAPLLVSNLLSSSGVRVKGV